MCQPVLSGDLHLGSALGVCRPGEEATPMASLWLLGGWAPGLYLDWTLEGASSPLARARCTEPHPWSHCSGG